MESGERNSPDRYPKTGLLLPSRKPYSLDPLLPGYRLANRGGDRIAWYDQHLCGRWVHSTPPRLRHTILPGSPGRRTDQQFQLSSVVPSRWEANTPESKTNLATFVWPGSRGSCCYETPGAG